MTPAPTMMSPSTAPKPTVYAKYPNQAVPMKAQVYVNARTKNSNPLPIPVPFCCALGSLPPSIMQK